MKQYKLLINTDSYASNFERKIEEALANVIPVCPNCHRMIHRKRDNPLQLDEIKNIVSRELTFCK